MYVTPSVSRLLNCCSNTTLDTTRVLERLLTLAYRKQADVITCDMTLKRVNSRELTFNSPLGQVTDTALASPPAFLFAQRDADIPSLLPYWLNHDRPVP